MNKLQYLRQMHIHFYNENDKEMSHYYFYKWVAEANRLKAINNRKNIHTKETFILG